MKLKLITIFDMASFKYFVAYRPIPTFRTVFGDDSFMFAVPGLFFEMVLKAIVFICL